MKPIPPTITNKGRAKPTRRKVIDGVLIAIGLFFLAYFAVQAISDLDGFLTRDNAERFLVVPALTIAFVPFLYLVAWYSRRELVSIRNRLRSGEI